MLHFGLSKRSCENIVLVLLTNRKNDSFSIIHIQMRTKSFHY